MNYTDSLKSERINNIVYQLRRAKGVTQAELAQAAGITRQTVIAIEKGDYTPSLLLAFKIGKFFNLKIEEIFSYEKNK